MNRLRFLLVLLIALTAMGPRCAMAVPVPAPAMHHADHQRPSHEHEAQPCADACIGCAVALGVARRIDRAAGFTEIRHARLPLVIRTSFATRLDPPPPRAA